MNNKTIFALIIGFNTLFCTSAFSLESISASLSNSAASGALSETAVGTPAVQNIAEPARINLDDKLHNLKSSLSDESQVHYYAFKAERGQKIILKWNDDVVAPPHLELEVFDGMEWRAQLPGNALIMDGAKPGQEVVIRIRHKLGTDFLVQEYDLYFGSYPVMKSSNLEDEFNVVRIPMDAATPYWLHTQGYNHAGISVEFTDSTGVALEGAVAELVLDLKESRIPTIREAVVTNAYGKGEKIVTTGRCAGGRYASRIVNDSDGNGWQTQYYAGVWFIYNKLLGADSANAEAKSPWYFGHICHQRLVPRRY